MIDKNKLWEGIAVPSYSSLTRSQIALTEAFDTHYSEELPTDPNKWPTSISFYDFLNITDTLGLSDLELALVARTVVFHAQWSTDAQYLFSNQDTWWKMGVALDMVLSKKMGTSLERWGIANAAISKLEVRQGILYKQTVPIGPAGMSTIITYYKNINSNIEDAECSTFESTMIGPIWSLWKDVIKAVP